jgi:hypothetical protein
MFKIEDIVGKEVVVFSIAEPCNMVLKFLRFGGPKYLLHPSKSHFTSDGQYISPVGQSVKSASQSMS